MRRTSICGLGQVALGPVSSVLKLSASGNGTASGSNGASGNNGASGSNSASGSNGAGGSSHES